MIIFAADLARGPDISTYVTGRMKASGALEILETGTLQPRVVRSAQRKRRLRRRGEIVSFNPGTGEWIWYRRVAR